MKYSEIKVKVNDKMRLIRQAHGYTQENVAEELGMSTNGYCNIERGYNDINLTKLAEFAAVFKMTVYDVLEYGEQGTKKQLIQENVLLKTQNELLQLQLKLLSNGKA